MFGYWNIDFRKRIENFSETTLHKNNRICNSGNIVMTMILQQKDRSICRPQHKQNITHDSLQSRILQWVIRKFFSSLDNFHRHLGIRLTLHLLGQQIITVWSANHRSSGFSYVLASNDRQARGLKIRSKHMHTYT